MRVRGCRSVVGVDVFVVIGRILRQGDLGSVKMPFQTHAFLRFSGMRSVPTFTISMGSTGHVKNGTLRGPTRLASFDP